MSAGRPDAGSAGLATRAVTAGGERAGPRRLYVLHGFFGAGRNWRSFARQLVDLRSDWTALLVDLRLHGESRHLEGPHSLAAAAADVLALEAGRADGGAVAVLGHSFGGKVALDVTRRLSPVPIQTWVIDSTPAPLTEGGSATRMLERVEASPPTFPDRAAGVAWIVDGGFDEATARWMAANLGERDGEWEWRLDTAGLRELLEDFGRSDLWPVLEAPPADSDLHVVRATSGSLLAAGDVERLRALSVRGEPVSVHELDGGHWLHVDNPDGLLELIADRLPR